MAKKDAEKPITLARVERALDRLAIWMMRDDEIAVGAIPIYERLEREAEILRSQEATIERARERAQSGS